MVIKLNTARLNGTRLNSASLNGVGERLRASAGGGGGVIIPPPEPEEPDTPVTYTLAATADNGKVSASVNGKSVTLPYVVNAGDVVVMEVTADEGFMFEEWSDGNTDNPRSITMTADVTLSATCVVKAVEKEYIEFADPAVEAVLMAKGVSSDGVGITKEDAAAVTSIGTWFKGNTEITSFNELKYFTGVTEIKANAFNSCSSLASINLDNVTIIRNAAFYGCSALNQYMHIPQVTILENQSFRNSGIVGADISGVQVLTGGYNGGAFGACSSLREVIFSPSLTDIQQFSFINCTALESANIPESVTAIGTQAFYGCTSLAFDYLNLLNLTSLGQNAFYGVKIKKLNLGKVTSLPSASNSSQNYGDKGVLEEVILSEGLTDIPTYSFYKYTALTACSFPSSLTKISRAAFFETALDGDLYLENVDNIESAAYYKTNVTSVSAPKLLNILDATDNYGAFGDCEKLKDVSMPLLTKIGQAAFRNCYALEEVIFPSAQTVGRGAFHGCGALKRAEFGSDVSSIDIYAFNQCGNMETLIVRAITPPTLGGAFSTSAIGFLIYVPDAALEVYKTATNWSAYADRIHPLSELEGSPYIQFADAKVERVLMENNVSSDGVGITMADAQAVTSIGTWFKGNQSIETFDELQYFTGLTYLTTTSSANGDNAAFFDCTSLRRVTLPLSITMIGDYSFCKCSSLSEIKGVDNVVKINRYAFQYTALTELEFPNVSESNGGPFSSSAATKLLLPNFVKTSGSLCDQMTNLQLLLLGANTNRIGTYSFWRMTNNQTTLICLATTPPTLEGSNNLGFMSAIYVPDASVDAYKSATNWTSASAKFKGVSQLATDNPTLYEEIQKYL